MKEEDNDKRNIDWSKNEMRREDIKEVKEKVEDGIKVLIPISSGFWGVARHLNYVFELMLALSWR